MQHPILRTFSTHYRQKYGFPIGKIPLHLGEVCPNREKGGCVFCSVASFAPGYLDAADVVAVQLRRGKEQLLQGRFKRYFGYFQQETPTSSSVDDVLHGCKKVLQDSNSVGLILSTRPDYVQTALLDELAAIVSFYNKDCLFEIGLQSVHDKSLRILNRNHTFADFENAFATLKRYHAFEVGAHLIFGVPQESEQDMLDSVRTVCDLGVDALKLHHLQVLKDTELEKMYHRGEVQPFTLKYYYQLLLKIIPLIPQNVVIHRLWASAHPGMLIAPNWNVLATELSRKLMVKLQQEGLHQGKSAR